VSQGARPVSTQYDQEDSMRVSRLATMALSVTMTLGSFAAAHATPITAGSFEFSPSLAFNRASFTPPTGVGGAGTATHLNFNVSAARAMNEQFQIMAGVLLLHRDIQGDGRTAVGASFGGQFNFAAQENLLPFVSANLGVIQYRNNGYADRALLAPMLRVGFRSMIGDARSLNVSVGFQHEANAKSTMESSANVFDVGVGMSLFRAHP
jgi:hypothetical protein